MPDSKINIEISGKETISEQIKKVKSELKDLNKEIDNSSTGSKKLSLDFAALKAPLVAAAISIAAVTAALFKFTDAAATYGDIIAKASDKTNISTKFLSVLRVQAEYADVDFNNITKAIGEFNKRLFTANDTTSKEAKTLEYLGITLKNNDGSLRSTEEIYRETVDSLSKLTDQTEKVTATNILFGRSGIELLGVFNEGATGIDNATKKAERFNLIISQKNAKGAADFKDSMTDLKNIFTGFGILLLDTVAPSIKNIVDDIVLFLSKKDNLERIKEVFANIGNAITNISRNIEEAINFVGSLEDELERLDRIMKIINPGGAFLTNLGKRLGLDLFAPQEDSTSGGNILTESDFNLITKNGYGLILPTFEELGDIIETGNKNINKNLNDILNENKKQTDELTKKQEQDDKAFSDRIVGLGRLSKLDPAFERLAFREKVLEEAKKGNINKEAFLPTSFDIGDINDKINMSNVLSLMAGYLNIKLDKILDLDELEGSSNFSELIKKINTIDTIVLDKLIETIREKLPIETINDVKPLTQSGVFPFLSSDFIEALRKFSEASQNFSSSIDIFESTLSSTINELFDLEKARIRDIGQNIASAVQQQTIGLFSKALKPTFDKAKTNIGNLFTKQLGATGGLLAGGVLSFGIGALLGGLFGAKDKREEANAEALQAIKKNTSRTSELLNKLINAPANFINPNVSQVQYAGISRDFFKDV